MTYLNAIRDFTRNHPVWATIIICIGIVLLIAVVK